MEATSDDKEFLHIKVLRIFIRRGWRMYFSIRRSFQSVQFIKTQASTETFDCQGASFLFVVKSSDFVDLVLWLALADVSVLGTSPSLSCFRLLYSATPSQIFSHTQRQMI
jgi:hypothetical protein